MPHHLFCALKYHFRNIKYALLKLFLKNDMQNLYYNNYLEQILSIYLKSFCNYKLGIIVNYFNFFLLMKLSFFGFLAFLTSLCFLIYENFLSRLNLSGIYLINLINCHFINNLSILQILLIFQNFIRWNIIIFSHFNPIKLNFFINLKEIENYFLILKYDYDISNFCM